MTDGCTDAWGLRLILIGRAASDSSSAGKKVEDEHDDGEDKKDVNPSAHCVAADESYDPENEENNCDCPKHGWDLLDDIRPLFARFAVVLKSRSLPVVSCRIRGGGCQ
jgi:hypothetical protein